MKDSVKKAIATFLFVFSIGCVVFAINGNILSVVAGAVAAAVACMIAEDIDKRANNNIL